MFYSLEACPPDQLGRCWSLDLETQVQLPSGHLVYNDLFFVPVLAV